MENDQKLYLNSNPGFPLKVLDLDIRLRFYFRHSTDTIPLRSGFNPAIPVSLTLRNDSVNSIHSSSSSRSSLPPSGNLGSPERIPKSERILKSPIKSPMFDDGKDFSEISMPEEGELSNLDVQWFLDYNTTLSRKSK